MKTIQSAIQTLLVLSTAAMVSGQRAYADEANPDPGEFQFIGETVVLPLTQQTGHPKVTIDLGDSEQYTFVVDTGASVNVMDSSIADSRGYVVVGETEIGAPGGPQIPAEIVRVPMVRVGDATIRDADFVTMDIIGLSMGSMHGVLSLGLFRDYLLTFDQAGGQIRVARGDLSAGEPGVLPYDDVSEHIQIKMDVAGTAIETHVDTGSMGEFVLPMEIIESVPLQEKPQSGATARLVGGERDIRFAQLNGTIEFAGFEFKNPSVAFMEPSPGFGNIGMGVMGEMVVSVDQQKHLIAFRKPTGDNVLGSKKKPRSLGVMFRGMGDTSKLTIANVVPGSLAATAGFVAGDKLISVNGRAAGEYAMPELGDLLRGPSRLSFEIDRDGESRTIVIR